METQTLAGRIVRYSIAGLIGGALQTATLYVWIQFMHLEAAYLWGATVGFCLALIVTFSLQKYWTFRDLSEGNIHHQFLIYTGIALLSLGLTILLLHTSKSIADSAGVDFFKIWYLVAQILTVGIVGGLSFIANYLVTFQKPL